MHCKPNGAFHGNSSETNILWITFVFIGPKSNHCFALSLICWNCYIDLYLSMYFSPFAKQNQAEVWPRFQSLLKLLLWTKAVEWVKVLNASGRSCLWQCLMDHSLSKSAGYENPAKTDCFYAVYFYEKFWIKVYQTPTSLVYLDSSLF